MKKLPKFTVLMSVYINETPKNLDECLVSLEKQTILPQSIVLVEDGEITNSLQDIINFHNGRILKIKEVKLKENQGLGNALKEGTKYVDTEWIARMDSDDIAVKNRFEIQLSAVVNNSNLKIVGGQLDEFEGDIHHIVGRRKVPLSQTEIYKFSKYRSPFNHPTVLINTNFLKSVGGYKKFEHLEDYHLWGRMISAKVDCCNVPETVLHMRTDGGMYKRRGGLKYLIKYFELRTLLNKWHIISKREQWIGNLLMVVNVILSGKIRETIYKQVLHRN